MVQEETTCKRTLFNMFGTDKPLYNQSIVLIKTKEDFEEFVNNHLNKPCSKLMALASFRKWKRSRNPKLSLKEFKEHFEADAKQAIEDLSLLPIEKEQVDFINVLLHKDSLTLEDIYSFHEKEPDKPIYRLVLTMGRGE